MHAVRVNADTAAPDTAAPDAVAARRRVGPCLHQCGFGERLIELVEMRAPQIINLWNRLAIGLRAGHSAEASA